MSAFITGSVLAVVVGLFGTFSRLDRDRAFYATVVIVVASYYVLFAFMAMPEVLPVAEITVLVLYAVLAVTGFRYSQWLIVFLLALHGVFDLVHDMVITNPGVPQWWPGFCLGYDVLAAVYLGSILLRRQGWRQAPAAEMAD